MIDSPFEEDSEETNPLDTRYFFELMQAYRWERVNAAKEFEAVKEFISKYMQPKKLGG